MTERVVEPTKKREDGLSVLVLSLLLCEWLPVVLERSGKWWVGHGIFDILRLLGGGRAIAGVSDHEMRVPA